MALIDKETIRKEIERLIGIHSTEVSDRVKRGVSPIDSENDTSMALIGQCHQLLGFLDTIKETPTWVNRAEQRKKDQAAGKKIAIMEIRAEIERRIEKPISFSSDFENGCVEGNNNLCDDLLSFLDTLPEQPVEMPDKDAILRICKLHKAWSIIAPWENVEDFIITNWNSENIV